MPSVIPAVRLSACRVLFCYVASRTFFIFLVLVVFFLSLSLSADAHLFSFVCRRSAHFSVVAFCTLAGENGRAGALHHHENGREPPTPRARSLVLLHETRLISKRASSPLPIFIRAFICFICLPHLPGLPVGFVRRLGVGENQKKKTTRKLANPTKRAGSWRETVAGRRCDRPFPNPPCSPVPAHKARLTRPRSPRGKGRPEGEGGLGGAAD